MKPEVCLVLPGSGTRVASLAGVVAAMRSRLRIVAVAGTSGGGLMALCVACGFTDARIRRLCHQMLTKTNLLDRGPIWARSGRAVYRGARIREELKLVFGDRRMRDLVMPVGIVVVALWAGGQPFLVTQDNLPDALVRDVAYCTMAIQGFFDPGRLEPDNAQEYGDGGAAINLPAGAWDHRPEPTVLVRFADQQSTHTLETLTKRPEMTQAVRSFDSLGVGRAAFGALLGAANASWPCRKKDQRTITIDSDADGMQFGLTPAEVDRRIAQGALPALVVRPHD